MILWVLWRRRLLGRLDGEKLRWAFGRDDDPLTLSRRYPLWRIVASWRALFVPAHAAGVARWLEYRLNLFDGVEG